jgi:hypothetical protein
MRTSLLIVLSLIAGLMATPGAAEEAGGIEIVALSNRADLVSGDDVLVEVRLPAGLAVDAVRVDVDGRDVTSAFAVRDDGRFVGLVEGLKLGENTLTAAVPTRRGREGARLTVTNHPIGGPIFSGPQIQPWYCLPDALDAQCNRPTAFTWQYKNTDGEFGPYDPANPPDNVATTTTDEGKTVPYIVRLETGNMDRSQYQIAVLADPEQPFERWSGPPAWNHKIYVLHGGGCGMGHNEAPAPSVIYDLALSRGYATMSTALENNQENCNVVVQAESVMMAKEHLIERYGDVRYMIGSGGSGGSMAQLHMANAYPGLYDGIMAGATFPDPPINDLLDCVALLRYWENPTRWGPGVVWTEPHQAAAAGLAATSVCQAWTKVPLTWYSIVFNPQTGAACDVDVEEPEKVYHPTNNPDGVRCSFQDYLINIFGQRPPDRWGPIEKLIGRGFGGRPYDNVGVQYGLRALLAGDITRAQFVDLNAKIGAVDIDFGTQPERVAADPNALGSAYRSGVVNEANNLDRVPIIDVPGFVSGDNYEAHDIYKSWGLRQRLLNANGHHDNQVIWYGPDEFGRMNREWDVLALQTMDEWLAAIESDTRAIPIEEKVVANKPDSAFDRCHFINRGACDEVFGPAGNTRWGAGMPTLANDVVKCRLQPLRRNDYAPIHFTDAEWAVMQKTFPSGVCDWSKPGVGQQPGVSWQTYGGGPGGRPMPAPPQSLPLQTLRS